MMQSGTLLKVGVAVLCAVIISSLLRRIVHYVMLRRKNFPPGPLPLPLVGNLHLLTDNHLQRKLSQVAKHYGSVMTIWFGSRKIVVVSSIEAANEFLVSKGRLFAGRPISKTGRSLNPTPGGLVSADYSQEWRENRKHVHRFINCTGTNSTLLRRPIEEETHHVINLLQETVGKETELWNVMFLYTTNVISRILYSNRIEIDSHVFKTFAKAFKLTNALVRRSLWKRVYDRIFPRQIKSPLVAVSSMMYEETERQIKKHRELMKEDVTRDWLDELLSANDEQSGVPSVQQACPVATDMYLAAVDSTKNSLLWGVLYLCHYPEIQQKLHDEIDQHSCGEDKVSSHQQGTMPYLEAFIHEILRHSCVSSFGQPHKAMGDCKLAGYSIPAGQVVMFNTYAIHYDERYWERPEEFRPERFLNEKRKFFIPNESFIPFSRGTRSCIGEGVAKLEMFVVLSNLLKKFEISFPSGKRVSLEGQRELSWAPQLFPVVLHNRQQ